MRMMVRSSIKNHCRKIRKCYFKNIN